MQGLIEEMNHRHHAAAMTGLHSGLEFPSHWHLFTWITY